MSLNIFVTEKKPSQNILSSTGTTQKVLFWLFRSVFPVLPVPFCLSCSAFPFRLSCSGWPVLSVLPVQFCRFFLSSPVCLVLHVMLCLSYSACPVLAVLFCQSCSACPVLPVLFLSCSAWPVLSVLFCISCSTCLILPFLLYLFCPGFPFLLLYIYQHTNVKQKENFAVPEWTHSTVVLFVTVPFCDSFVLLLILFCDAIIVWLYCSVMVLSSNLMYRRSTVLWRVHFVLYH